MLVDETRAVVDLVVHNHEQILLGSMLRDVGVGVVLVGHCAGVVCGRKIQELVVEGVEDRTVAEEHKKVSGSSSSARGGRKQVGFGREDANRRDSRVVRVYGVGR